MLHLGSPMTCNVSNDTGSPISVITASTSKSPVQQQPVQQSVHTAGNDHKYIIQI